MTLSARRLILSALLAIAVAIPSAATEKPEAKEEMQAADTAAAVETVSLEGTDLARMLRRDAKVERLPTRFAGERLDVGGGYRSVLVVAVDAEGKPVMSCVANVKAAKKALAEPRPRVREP